MGEDELDEGLGWAGNGSSVMTIELKLIGKQGWDGLCWEMQSENPEGRGTRGNWS